MHKEVLQEGEGSKKPKAGDELTVHYVGTLQSDGTQFDSSRDRGEAFKFTLDKGQVIKGWDVGMATMTKGERARFTLQAHFAYGQAGSPPKIPPNAVLIFEVELVSWVSKDDLFGDGGVVRSVIQEGRQSWKHPEKDGEVCISLTATAEGGVLEERSCIDYVLGSGSLGSLSRVVDKALLDMSKDGKCSLACSKGYVREEAQGEVTVELHLHGIYSTRDVSLLKDGTVIKKTIAEGEGYKRPEDGDAVTLRVEAVTDGAAPLAGFPGAKDVQFTCCAGEVCDVLDGVVLDMKKGERAVVTCMATQKVQGAAELGLGEVKAAKVVLTVELKDFSKGKDVWSLSESEKMELAATRKAVAANLFKARRFELALQKYKKVVDSVRNHESFKEDSKEKAVDLKRTAELNKAACYLQLKDFGNTLSSCNSVLKEDRSNVKALFRRAKAYHGLSEHMEAEKDLVRILELDPANSEAKAMLPQVRHGQKLLDKAAKQTFAKMCEGLGKPRRGEKRKHLESKPQKKEPEVVKEPMEPDVQKDTF